MGCCCSNPSTKDVKSRTRAHTKTVTGSINSPLHSGADDDDDMSYYSALDDSQTEEYIRKQKLEELQKMFPDSSKMDLLAFLKFRDYNLEEAELQYRNTLAFRKNAPKLTIIDVAPFIMVSAIQTHTLASSKPLIMLMSIFIYVTVSDGQCRPGWLLRVVRRRQGRLRER